MLLLLGHINASFCPHPTLPGNSKDVKKNIYFRLRDRESMGGGQREMERVSSRLFTEGGHRQWGAGVDLRTLSPPPSQNQEVDPQPPDHPVTLKKHF